MKYFHPCHKLFIDENQNVYSYVFNGKELEEPYLEPKHGPYNTCDYISVRVRSSYVKKELLHRLVYECFYGEIIPPGKLIHHKDKNKLNNHPSNLECISYKEHKEYHSYYND